MDQNQQLLDARRRSALQCHPGLLQLRPPWCLGPQQAFQHDCFDWPAPVQNVSLGYSLPQKWISILKMTRLRAYVSGQNLYVFTPYKGLDPEIGALNQNVFLSNVDVGRFPIPRTITFGINAEF